jgi:magnesium-transporting ATPase (P-type)
MGALSGQDLINIRNSLSEENSLELIDFSSSRKRASIVVRQ